MIFESLSMSYEIMTNYNFAKKQKHIKLYWDNFCKRFFTIKIDTFTLIMVLKSVKLILSISISKSKI
jgi:hypothetical protein